MEAVAVRHGGFTKELKVLLPDGFYHQLHVLWHNYVDPSLEQPRCSHCRLHARGARYALLRGTCYQNQRSHLRPVARRGYFNSLGITAINLLPLDPGHVASKQGPTRRAGALSCNDRKLRRARGELVEVSDGADESGEARGRTGESRGGGEVVLADDPQGERGDPRSSGVGVLHLRTQGPEFPKTCLGSRAGDILGLAVQEQGIGLEFRGAGGGGVGAKVRLRQCHG